MKHCLHCSMCWGYLYNKFIVNIISNFILLDNCLSNVKPEINSLGVCVRESKSYLYMPRKASLTCWRAKWDETDSL